MAPLGRTRRTAFFLFIPPSIDPAAWRDAVHSWDFDDTIVASLSLEQRLSLAETFGDEFGLVLGDVSWHSLRLRIEHLAALTVHMLSEQVAAETIGQIKALLDGLCLEPDAVRKSGAVANCATGRPAK